MEDTQILGIQPRAQMRGGAEDERRTVRESHAAQPFCISPLLCAHQLLGHLDQHSFLPCANRSAISLAFADRSLYLNMCLASLGAIVLSFARVNVGDNSENLFIFPTAPRPSNNFIADLSWPLGSTQKIQWSTTLDEHDIASF